MKLLLRPAAAAELEEAFRWYERQRPGLGEELLRAVDSALVDVLEQPLRHPEIHRDVRRALVRRFPFAVFYRLLDDRLVVLAILHGGRDPRRWQTRR